MCSYSLRHLNQRGSGRQIDANLRLGLVVPCLNKFEATRRLCFAFVKSSETRSRTENGLILHVLSIQRINMKSLQWAYTTCNFIPKQELRGEEGGGLMIYGGRIIGTLRYIYLSSYKLPQVGQQWVFTVLAAGSHLWRASQGRNRLYSHKLLTINNYVNCPLNFAFARSIYLFHPPIFEEIAMRIRSIRLSGDIAADPYLGTEVCKTWGEDPFVPHLLVVVQVLNCLKYPLSNKVWFSYTDL